MKPPRGVETPHLPQQGLASQWQEWAGSHVLTSPGMCVLIAVQLQRQAPAFAGLDVVLCVCPHAPAPATRWHSDLSATPRGPAGDTGCVQNATSELSSIA